MAARDERPENLRECLAKWEGWRKLKIPALWELDVLAYIERLEARVDVLEGWRMDQAVFKDDAVDFSNKTLGQCTITIRGEAVHGQAPGTVPPMVGNAYEEVED